MWKYSDVSNNIDNGMTIFLWGIYTLGELGVRDGILKGCLTVLWALSNSGNQLSHLVLQRMCFLLLLEMLCCCGCAVTLLNAQWWSVKWAWALDYLCLNCKLLRICWQTQHFYHRAGQVTTHRKLIGLNLVPHKKCNLV